MVINNKLFYIKQLLQNVRQLHCPTSIKAGYEGSCKTTLNILNHGIGSRILIGGCTTIGFTFTDGSMIIGPLAIFPKSILCWNIRSANHINEANLSLFTTLEPKLDIVVLGLETKYDFKRIYEMKKILTDKDISVEILPVDKACGVYNFLSQEGRYVAAGLIPPIEKATLQHKTVQAMMDTLQNQKALDSQ